MVHAFAVSSVVRGYHEYKDVWNAPNDEAKLSCKRETDNLRDTIEHKTVAGENFGKLVTLRIWWGKLW